MSGRIKIRTENEEKYYYAALLKNVVGHKKDTVILQLRRDIDCLDCEMWKYIGVTFKTKKDLRENKDAVLDAINKSYGTEFRRVIVD